MKRKNNPNGFRKRQANGTPDSHASSGVLREIRNTAQRGEFAQALAKIDATLGADPDPGYKSKLLSLAAACLFKQGKFLEAADAYGKIGQIVGGDPVEWLTPALAQVSSYLKAAQTDSAGTLAAAALQTAIANDQRQQAALASAAVNFASQGQATIPAHPPRPAEVANRLGKLFFAEGEADTAEAFFQQALQLSPNSCQARLGLAEIALNKGDAVAAARLAREALTLGKYQAKTLAAWPLLLAAARKTGMPIEAGLLSGLSASIPSVHARAILILVRGWRSQNDPGWQTLATDWLQRDNGSHPRVTAELKKLMLANARKTPSAPDGQLKAAQQLLATPGISPMEWLSGTKRTLHAALLSGQNTDVSALIQQGLVRYGQSHAATFTRSLAMVCQKAKQPELALALMQQAVWATAGEDQRTLLWALAKLQAAQGSHAEAATSYWTYSQDTAAPQRLQLYAYLQYAVELFKSQQTELIEQAMPQLDTALARVQDYSALLDVARQLRYSRFQQGKALAESTYQRGKQLALQAFDAAGHPSPAATILFKFCRRAGEFYRHDDVIATWTRLNAQKRSWLWSPSSDYWSWIELVFRSYRNSGNLDDATRFIADIWNDPATPAKGIGALAVSYACLKRKQGDYAGMYAICERMVQTAPSYEWSADAYYWLALRAWKKGDTAQTTLFARNMLTALGQDCALYWKANYQAQAYCLLAGLKPDQAPAHCPVSSGKLESTLLNIQIDLAGIPT